MTIGTNYLGAKLILIIIISTHTNVKYSSREYKWDCCERLVLFGGEVDPAKVKE